MHERRFSQWLPWAERDKHKSKSQPGIYAIAVTKRPFSATAFNWTAEIVYIGMTNSVAGLAGRLKQFDNTIRGKRGHGGADRLRYRYRDYGHFVANAFVAVAGFRCDPKSATPRDLRAMGAVAKFEYQCLAEYVQRFGRLPEFNDKKKSPKFSLAVPRSKRRSSEQPG